MDPNECLEAIRTLIKFIQDPDVNVAEKLSAGTALAEYTEALDEWLSNGGFPPREWVTE